MAVDRDLLDQQMEEAQRRSGMFRYPKSGNTYRLRILEYTNSKGRVGFAQPRSEHRIKDQGGRGLGVCRFELADLPCPICRVNKIRRDNGKDQKFTTRTRYVMNAVDVDNDPDNVRLWVMPKTVFEAICSFATDDDWKDVLEPKKGCCFKIKVTGSGLDTEYKTSVERKPTPIKKSISDEVVDPIDKIRIPSMRSVCESIGLFPEDIYSEDEIEQEESDGKAKKEEEVSAKSGKTPKKTSKKEKPSGIEVGSKVKYEDEDEICEVDDFDETTGNVTIRDSKGEIYNVDLSTLTLVEEEEGPEFEIGSRVVAEIEGEPYHGKVSKIAKEGAEITFDDGDVDIFPYEDIKMEEEPEEEPEETSSSDDPQCFGDKDYYDPEDADCKGCSHFEKCGAKVKKGKKGKKGKKEESDSEDDDESKDVLADILG